MNAGYHLTARPWRPLEIPRTAYLDAVEDLCRREAQQQCVLTPCFAFAVGVLASEGRAADLVERAMLAMDHAGACLSAGRERAFFIAPLTGAFALLGRHAQPKRRALWEQRLRTPLARILEGRQWRLDNGPTYAMKGEWLRARAGLADAAMARAFVERNWIESGRGQMLDGEAAYGNLMAMIAAGYDGKSAAEIRTFAEGAAEASLLAQDPSGGHEFNVLNQFAFEVMAAGAGDPWTAGQYRRAAMLAFQSAWRWPLADRHGIAAMSLAEAALARRSEIAERPAPCEIGGYAFAAAPRLAGAYANAGGMQMVANLRDALGVVAFARAGWDSRLGLSGGSRGRAVSFAPTWMEGGRWVRLAEVSERYRGSFQVLFAHPLLVRCAIDYAPAAAGGGPVFRHEFAVTPEGVLATLQTSAPPAQYALTLPLPQNEGDRLEAGIAGDTAGARSADGDEQCYIALASRPGLSADGDPVRSGRGWLWPVRSRSNVTFVYPRSAGDPPAEAVRASFRQTPQGFASLLGRVAGNLYVGRTAAGGEGKSLDIDGDGRPEITFSAVCGFVAQLENGHVVAIEVDREVRAVVEGRRLALAPFVPVAVR